MASKPAAARLELPPRLLWTLQRGETEPILGWHARGLGRRVPTFCLLGMGRSVSGALFATRLVFLDVGKSPKTGVSREAISRRASELMMGNGPEIRTGVR